MIARIRTDENLPAKAVLGPKSKLEKLQLADGDEVTVTGRKGRVNDKSMLLAATVTSDGKEVSVDLPSSRNAKRIRAELLSMRTTEFQNYNGSFVIAEVQCSNGKKSTVNLGVQSKIDQLNLSKGDDLRLIVRPAKVNGKPGMVADEVMANGKSVKVSPPNQIAKRDRDDNSRRQGNNRGQDGGRDQDSRANSQASRQDSGQQDSSASRTAANPSPNKQAALGIAIGETGEGIVILGFHPESPAADTDLQIGDTIVSINGNPVESPEGLVETIQGMKPSEKIRVKIRREGEEQTLHVKLTSRSELMASLR